MKIFVFALSRRLGSNVLLYTCLIVVTASCSSIKVSSDFDHHVNFASYKTYAFTKEAEQLPIDDINRKRLIDAISNELAAKGFSKSHQPDVWVDMFVAQELKQTATATSSPNYYGGGYRYRWGGGFSTTTINVENYTEGTLFVDIVDSSTKQLVWQGRGVKTLDPDATPSQREKNINYAVKQIFTKYPPKK
jgi:hypothetical protein